MAPSTELKNGFCESAAATKQNGHLISKNEFQMEVKNDTTTTTTNNEVEVEMVVPPDGGWGWVIVAASFMCNLIVDGIIFSFGTFLKHIADEFKVTDPEVALVGSLQTGFYLMAGPFVSALANRYGFRLVAMVGSGISCIAFVLSSISPSVKLLCITYGLIGGVGCGLIYVPAVITTGFYFEKWRALATGIAVCGSGIGAFVLAPVSTELIKRYGWRTAMQIQGLMLLHCAIFGALFRPIKPKRIKVKQSDVTTLENIGNELKSPLMKNGISVNSLHASQPILHGRIFKTNNNAEYPTAAQILGSNPEIVINGSVRSLHRVPSTEKKIPSSEKRLSVPIYPELEIVKDETKTTEEENNLLCGDLERLNGRIPTVRRHTISGRRDENGSAHSLKKVGKRNSTTKDPPRPFYRDDIFYGGSLSRLAHYKSQMSSVGYHMSVTRLPTATDVEEEKSGNCYICPESVTRILTTMLDLSLLKSPSFLILAISGGLTMLGFYTPFMYLPGRTKDMNVDDSYGTMMVSLIGIANTIGRILCGILSSSASWADPLILNNIFITVGGVVTMLSCISMTIQYQLAYAFVFGLSISVFAALRSILVVDLMGLERLTNAFGLILLFQGVAATIGTPMAGFLGTYFDSTNAPFYIAGALIVISAVICYPIKAINKWEKRRVNQHLDEPTA